MMMITALAILVVPTLALPAVGTIDVAEHVTDQQEREIKMSCTTERCTDPTCGRCTISMRFPDLWKWERWNVPPQGSWTVV